LLDTIILLLPFGGPAGSSPGRRRPDGRGNQPVGIGAASAAPQFPRSRVGRTIPTSLRCGHLTRTEQTVGRRIVIIGGGLVGLGTAYALLRQRSGDQVTVLEKEDQLGQHQSTHNSGVLHAGLYYRPGSYKATLAVEGLRTMVAFCQEHGVRYDQCGKIVVATDEQEVGRLRALWERGQQNGLRGLRWLNPEEAREIEPNVHCKAALAVPEEGIVDYGGVVSALAAVLRADGADLQVGAAVESIRSSGPGWVITTSRAEYEADLLVNCAGLHSDRVARMAGEDPGCRIVPFRGEYYLLRPERAGLVRNLIYPVPDPTFPFLGVHFTRRIEGGVEAGPNAVLAWSREAYRKGTFRLGDAWNALAWPGLWRFVARHRGITWEELRRSYSARLFCRALQRLVPDVRESDLIPGGAGVRAQAMLGDGRLVEDFFFVERANALHVLNAPSPAATASLSIGAEIARRLATSRSPSFV
jgi:L-2-hydroxyglutarate oxidase